jgi:2-polyprenyl-6-methoxyphenol hydroxylase-like FAD-dependent oxidoreductase
MGLNLAIHDGTMLAHYLAAATSPGNQPETLDLYEQACRPLAEKLLEPGLAPAL